MSQETPKQNTIEYQEAELTEMILNHLAVHPEAMDTLEGIAQWWLMQEHIKAEVERVARVLKRLIEQGLVDEIRKGDLRLYQLKTATRESISRIACKSSANQYPDSSSDSTSYRKAI